MPRCCLRVLQCRAASFEARWREQPIKKQELNMGEQETGTSASNLQTQRSCNTPTSLMVRCSAARQLHDEALATQRPSLEPRTTLLQANRHGCPSFRVVFPRRVSPAAATP